MTTSLRRVLMAGGWRLPFPAFISPNQPVRLTYHGVPEAPDALGLCRRVFEEHVRFVTRHFEVIPPTAVREPSRPGGRIKVLFTFDAGFRNHAERVAPILRAHGVPAIFFVPTRHTTPGRYLWFAYLKLLERHFPGNGFMFRGAFRDMSPGTRRRTMAALEHELLALRPHPTVMYAAIDHELPRLEDFVDRAVIADQCAGMTVEQIQELAADPLFTIGGHTVDHPLLPRCEPAEQRRQIRDNKLWLESISRRPCEAFAYPGADYDAEVVRQCRDAGFTDGYGGEAGRGLDTGLELTRVGVYFPSLAELGNKVRWSRAIGYWRGGALQSSSPVTRGEPDTVGSSHA
jgi:peptidoglycan/xylan/chitin deacetylase (PgdA/CDA1 family)